MTSEDSDDDWEVLDEDDDYIPSNFHARKKALAARTEASRKGKKSL